MTTPTNAVEKPAAGCGCDYPYLMCSVAIELHNAIAAAYLLANIVHVRLVRELGAPVPDGMVPEYEEYDRLSEAYRAHVEGR